MRQRRGRLRHAGFEGIRAAGGQKLIRMADEAAAASSMQAAAALASLHLPPPALTGGRPEVSSSPQKRVHFFYHLFQPTRNGRLLHLSLESIARSEPNQLKSRGKTPFLDHVTSLDFYSELSVRWEAARTNSCVLGSRN